MKVIYTEKSQLLAARTAQKLGCGLSSVEYTTFPDGELYVRVKELDDEMVVVASTVDTTTALQVMSIKLLKLMALKSNPLSESIVVVIDS